MLNQDQIEDLKRLRLFLDIYIRAEEKGIAPIMPQGYRTNIDKMLTAFMKT